MATRRQLSSCALRCRTWLNTSPLPPELSTSVDCVSGNRKLLAGPASSPWVGSCLLSINPVYTLTRFTLQPSMCQNQPVSKKNSLDDESSHKNIRYAPLLFALPPLSSAPHLAMIETEEHKALLQELKHPVYPWKELNPFRFPAVEPGLL